jgi:hypothetical protein
VCGGQGRRWLNPDQGGDLSARWCLLWLAAWCLVAAAQDGQRAGPQLVLADVDAPPSERASIASVEHPAIAYLTAAPNDPVTQLNRRLAQGKLQLDFVADEGYYRSILQALDISASSQLLVFSKSSLQRRFISPSAPRALYFNDEVAVAFIRGAPLLELAAFDPAQGVIFFTIEQQVSAQPRAVRQESCLSCHLSRNSMDVPGMLVRSLATDTNGATLPQLGNYISDHRSVFAERWGGWYVTGDTGSTRHLGNSMLAATVGRAQTITPAATSLSSLAGKAELAGYGATTSDVAALMVFNHQMHMTNLLTRMGWETRVALAQPPTAANRVITERVLAGNARELVDYLLFVDEAPLAGKVMAATQFVSEFAARGPFDRQGRSLRQLDLQQRLLRYPCSYMIYTAAFDALPAEAKAAIYRRLWSVLAGEDVDARYRGLAVSDRRAILEILRDTKQELPGYFR